MRRILASLPMPRRSLLSLALLLCCCGAAFGQARLDRVSLAKRGDGKGYVIRLHTSARLGDADFAVAQAGPNAVDVTLGRTRLGSRLRRADPAGPVRGYMVRQRGSDVVLRVQLDPQRPLNVVYYPDGARPHMLVAVNYVDDGDVYGRPLSGEEVAARRAAPPETTAPPQETTTRSRARSPVVYASNDEAEPDGAEPTPTPVQPPRTVATSPARVPGNDAAEGEPVAAEEAESVAAVADGAVWRLDRIVIDAGHGGKDPGTMAHGAREKDIALAIALKLGRMIENELGIDVVYTRSDDRFIELEQRGKIANEAGGKLFVSIHVNAIGGARARTVKGTNTFFLGLHKSESARRVMERENAVVKLESNPEKYARFSEDDLIMQTLAQSAFLEKSEQLAGLIESQFSSRAGRHSRGVRQAGFYVLWSAAMPAVLVETGFLTHPEDARFLKSEAGQTEIAQAVFHAVRAYKNVYEKGLHLELAE